MQFKTEKSKEFKQIVREESYIKNLITMKDAGEYVMTVGNPYSTLSKGLVIFYSELDSYASENYIACSQEKKAYGETENYYIGYNKRLYKMSKVTYEDLSVHYAFEESNGEQVRQVIPFSLYQANEKTEHAKIIDESLKELATLTSILVENGVPTNAIIETVTSSIPIKEEAKKYEKRRK